MMKLTYLALSFHRRATWLTFSQPECTRYSTRTTGVRPLTLVNNQFRGFHGSNRTQQSRSRRGNKDLVEAIEFRISPQERYEYFESWVKNHTTFLRTPEVVDEYAYFVPFWQFECDVSCEVGGQVYQHYHCGPLTQIYSGDKFNRKMTEVLKNESSLAKPFSADMLELDGETAGVDAWHLYETTAWAYIRKQIQSEKQQVLGEIHPSVPMTIHFKNVISRKIYMPAHVVKYAFLGNEFRVFINGVTGQTFGLAEVPTFWGSELYEKVQRAGKWLLGFGLLSPLHPIFSSATRLLAKILLKPFFFLPAILSMGGYYAFFTQRKTFSEWYEEKEAERKMQAEMNDDWIFRPGGKKRQDYEKERQQSRTYRSREEEHQRSRESHFQSSEDKERRRQQEERLKRKHKESKKTKTTYKPTPVNPSDYYEVLGIKHLGPNASMEDIKSGFRKQMMKYHPDHNQHTGLDLQAAGERTKLILKAYKTLRDPHKKAEYDST